MSACASYSTRDSLPKKIEKTAVAEQKSSPLSVAKGRDSYVVFGKRYFPINDATRFEETGVASWYGKKFHGRRTSSGELYDMHAFTAAHKTLPLPTYVRVTSITDGKTVIVKVNDRGPFVAERIIDLSYAAASALGIAQQGTAMVNVSAIESLKQKNTNYSKNRKRFVQLGAFKNKKNALLMVEMVNKRLSERFPVEVRDAKDSWYKVLTVASVGQKIPEEIVVILKQLGINNYTYIKR